MRNGGYEIATPTDKGARRWEAVPKPQPRIGTLRLFGRKISV